MKRILLLISSLFLLSSCSCSHNHGPIPDSVADLAFSSSDGEVSWSTSTNATEYEYTVNDVDVFKTTETSINIFDVVKETSTTFLKVRAINGDNKSDYSTLSFTTLKLATPKKGVIENDPTTHDYLIAWEEVENASIYLVSVNGGRFVSYHTNVFKPSTKGNYFVEVKCKAYVKNESIVYLESDVSPRSETLGYMPGPALSNDEMNIVSWSVDNDTSFDSFNIWVNGKKVRDNVSSPLNLVTGENPILTKTGEYDIQIEAIKDGTSYWSNILEQLGTSNINPGEIYSFDNRKFNKVVPSGIDPGWVISDEQSHSEPYSLYIPTQTQVNLQKYAYSDINDVDYRKINKISYWVYVPTIEGYSGEIKGLNLPSIIYDGWGENAPHGRLVARAKESDSVIPFNTWTQLHFEVENQYDNIIILSKGATISLDDETSYSVPFYLDDICYDDVDQIDYEYKFKYDYDLCSGAWSNQPQKLSFGSEFANKEVEIGMDICGTASESGEHTLGFGAFNEEHKLTGIHTPINREYISSNTYRTFKFLAKLDENGDFYTTVYEHQASSDNNESFIVYAKNKVCEESKYSIGTLVPSHANANATYVSVLAIPTMLPVGTPVSVDMDIAVRTNGDYSQLRTTSSLWPNNTPDYSLVLSNSELKEDDGWRHIIFSAKVLNNEQINFHDGTDGYTHTFSGNYVLIYLHGHLSTDLFYYKEDSISVNALVEGNVVESHFNANATYVSVLAIPTNETVGTSMEVSMDVAVHTFGDYSELRTAPSLWATDIPTPHYSVIRSNSELKENDNYQTITFITKVLNNEQINFHDGKEGYTHSFTGNYILVYLHGHLKTDYFCYKENTIQLTSLDVVPNTAGPNNTGYYQNIVGLKADYLPGANVTVEMDILITGTYDEYSGFYWLNTVYSNDLWNNAPAIMKNDTGDITNINDGEWHHILFNATVRNFAECGIFEAVDTSDYGNAVYIVSRQKSSDAFCYKNVNITLDNYSMTPSGDNGNKNDKYYQSITGLSTELAVGTAVAVEMDVKITGTFNSYSDIYWVDAVHTVDGGERKTATNIKYLFDTSDTTNWQHISFTATVRNFPHLRQNSSYPVADTSSFGNAVYLLAVNKTADSFDYKNVSMTSLGFSTTPGGAHADNNGYYQSLAGLTTDLEVGTTVTVDMDIRVTGTFDSYSGVYWVDDVWTTTGGESDKTRTDITSEIITGEEGWHHVTFTATVRNFPNLRFNAKFTTMDTSSFGNAVYLITQNKSADAFYYKNVIITAC